MDGRASKRISIDSLDSAKFAVVHTMGHREGEKSRINVSMMKIFGAKK